MICLESMKGWFIVNTNSENFNSKAYPGNGYIIIDVDTTPRVIQTCKSESNPVVTRIEQLEQATIYKMITVARKTMGLSRKVKIYVDKYGILDSKYIISEHKLYAPVSFYNDL